MRYSPLEMGSVTAMLSLLAGCAGSSSHRVAEAPGSPQPLTVPSSPAEALLPRKVIAAGIANPRGMELREDGSLLVSSAGTGDPEHPNTGQLLALHDANGDGDFDDAGERQVLLDEQPSANILDFVRRDEVFGMAGMARSPDALLVALAFFGGPSTLFRVDGAQVSVWGTTHGNINDLAFDPARRQWFGAASSTDEIVRIAPGGRAERVVKFPPLASGQDAVPAYLRSDPRSGELLVSLFSGSPEGEEGGKGVELVRRAASIVAVNPDTHAVRTVVGGLTVPTDLELGRDGSLYVTEFCDAFLEPVATRQEMFTGTKHGGFRRFSGRLLRIDRSSGAVTVVAKGLDAPTDLALAGDALLVAEGMGTPGRSIPGPTGPQPLQGFIERVELSAPASTN
jgi:hypothetical protein